MDTIRDNVVPLVGYEKGVVDHYEEVKSYSYIDEFAPDDDRRIILATKKGDDSVLYVAMSGPSIFEILAAYRNSELGRQISDEVGDAAAAAATHEAICNQLENA